MIGKSTRGHVSNSQLEVKTGDCLRHLGKIAAAELTLRVKCTQHRQQRQHEPARRIRSQDGKHNVWCEQQQGKYRVGSRAADQNGQSHYTGLAVYVDVTTIVRVKNRLRVQCQGNCVDERSPA